LGCTKSSAHYQELRSLMVQSPEEEARRWPLQEKVKVFESVEVPQSSRSGCTKSSPQDQKFHSLGVRKGEQVTIAAVRCVRFTSSKCSKVEDVRFPAHVPKLQSPGLQ
jgi:hypothetical protein